MKEENLSYILKFTLTNFFGAHISDVQSPDGDIERCVCIPIDKNDLVVSRNNRVNSYAFVNRSFVATKDNWSHYLQMKSSSSFANKQKSLGYKMPYLGNLKPYNVIFNKESYLEKIKGKKVKVKDYE